MTNDPQTFSWPASQLAGSPNNADQVEADAAAAALERSRQGFEQGYADGLARVQAEADAGTQQQVSHMAQIADQAATIYQSWQQQQLELLQLVATHVLGEALAVQPGSLQRLLAQAQSQLPNLNEPMVACHPDRVAALSPQLQQRLIADPTLPGHAIELREDASVLQMDLANYVAQLFADWPLEWPAVTALNPEPNPDLSPDSVLGGSGTEPAT